MYDFSIDKYEEFLDVLKSHYVCLGFKDYLDIDSKNISDSRKVSILRHDVDLLPENSLSFAKIQAKVGVYGTYNFRTHHKSWNEKIIREISELGHEIGYHYENMDTCNGDVKKAWDNFRYDLEKIRKLADVKTICMHGSPLSKYDNRLIWKEYDYKSLDLVGEPYYDLNYKDILYLTDTGRCWDGYKYSVRDKVPEQQKWIKNGIILKSTDDIIQGIIEDILPKKISFTFHPQRWHESISSWIKELVVQNIKNQIKLILIRMR